MFLKTQKWIATVINNYYGHDSNCPLINFNHYVFTFFLIFYQCYVY